MDKDSEKERWKCADQLENNQEEIFWQKLADFQLKCSLIRNVSKQINISIFPLGVALLNWSELGFSFAFHNKTSGTQLGNLLGSPLGVAWIQQISFVQRIHQRCAETVQREFWINLYWYTPQIKNILWSHEIHVFGLRSTEVGGRAQLTKR